MTAALTVRGLTVAYRHHVAVRDATVTVPAGHVVALVGPNGAGKSTLLKATVGLVPTRSGTVRFHGRRFDEVRHRVGYMPQAAMVDRDFPATVADVVRMGRYGRRGWFRRPTAEDRRIADEALACMGIADLRDRQISELSGGQQQRTFMARILAQDPDVFLLDEPLAGVDVASARTIEDRLRDLRAAGRTVVMVHHDLSGVRALADEVVLLRDGDVLAQGPARAVLTDDAILRAYGLHDERAAA
ncbi:metal ABC transporter ATP-binding protein [uncultured Tessaracoccus sp.]|uniref:metal ABC transporter ATP-binding protein n=1 Tax=uncultured Tessaracoccus sp. TaxID=905023 RepID=UPI0025F4B0FC|nr:metal ABC transporter ATP-binding protein [uncultured Tessaracoccus sp.]